MMKPAIKPRTKASGDTIRAAILTEAATPQGFAVNDKNNLQYHCNILMQDGRLYRAFINNRHVRYFVSNAAAKAYWTAHAADNSPDYLETRRSAASQKVLAAPKAVKAQKALAFSYKPAAPTTPRRDAQIIWPEHIKPVCRMMPAQRNQVVTFDFVHGSMRAMR
jgi:hypothetical protein